VKKVVRENLLEGAILTRVASSHIRVEHFSTSLQNKILMN
jgi:Uncharacterized conserved protein